MKKKVKTILFVFIIIGVVILNITYKNKNEVTKTKRKKQNNLAIMIKEDGASDYTKSSSKDIPKGNYALNRDKSYCKNNGVIGDYDNTLGKISFSFIGTDSCYLYFDVITDTEKPVISNLKVNGTEVTATLSDNIELLCYGISTSNSVEPTSWTTISGTTYNLSTTITTEGIYYLWVKDSAGNKAVSDVIDLEKKGWQTILANNTVNETIPDFSKATTASEKGLYKADDDYTATTGMKSYYFRGAVNNNWVQFGKDSSGKDIYWRIIRINGDGSIRMIYSGTTDPKTDSSVTGSNGVYMAGTGTQITVDSTNTFAFNSSSSKAEYVGYQYIERQQHGYRKCDGTNNASCTVNGNTVYNSTIKQKIDKWYAGTTLKDNDLIADQILCNDRSATTSSSGTPGEISGSMSTSTTYYYGAYVRLVTNKSPKLTCTTASDKFTVNTSNGTGALTYPVGLITADEVAMAGGNSGTGNSSYYLYTNQYYWSGSPYYFLSSYTYAYEFYVNSSGGLKYNRVNFTYGARPVVSLSSKAKLSGNGTYNDVYTVN